MKNNLENVLKKRQLTKYRFAQLLKKDIPNVFRMFREDFNPRLDTLVDLARVLECGLDDIIVTKHKKKRL